jgi:hypothetical protein
MTFDRRTDLFFAYDRKGLDLATAVCGGGGGSVLRLGFGWILNIGHDTSNVVPVLLKLKQKIVIIAYHRPSIIVISLSLVSFLSIRF